MPFTTVPGACHREVGGIRFGDSQAGISKRGANNIKNGFAEERVEKRKGTCPLKEA